MSEGDHKGKYFRKIFDEVQSFNVELMTENERLRSKLALMEHESVVKSTAPAEPDGSLRSELEKLRAERDQLLADLEDLKARFDHAKLQNDQFAERYVTIEKQNANLAALYVASYQLHSTLDLDEVLERINEVVINLVGSERFGTYILDSKSRTFTLVAGEGMGDQIGKTVPWGKNFISKVARSGQLFVADDSSKAGDEEQPLAAVPLRASEELLGVLIIYELLGHKDGFEPIDLELFDLLAGHAATALMAAKLYTKSQRKANTLESFMSLLKESGVADPPIVR